MSAVATDRQEVTLGKSKFSFDPDAQLHIIEMDGRPAIVYVLRNGRLVCFTERGPLDVPPNLKDKITAMYFGTETDSTQ